MAYTSEKPKGETGPGEYTSDLESLLPNHSFAERVGQVKSFWLSPKATKTTLAILGWYALNAIYIIENRIALEKLPLPWTISSLQLVVGMVFPCIFWLTGFRKVPKFVSAKIFALTIIPQGFCHLFVHLGAVISMGLGAVAFTHVVKAAEPVITAALSIIILREFLRWGAYASLVPIVTGVALASFKEVDFNIAAFGFAMLSNVGSSLRSICAKLTMKNKEEIGEELTAPNIYMLLIIVSGIFSIPIALAIESSQYAAVWKQATANLDNFQSFSIVARAVMSGVCYYLCNDFAFICLGELNQVSHSVANTVKRVVLITSSILFFQTPVTPLGVVGMAIAILGTFFYALFK